MAKGYLYNTRDDKNLSKEKSYDRDSSQILEDKVEEDWKDWETSIGETRMGRMNLVIIKMEGFGD